MSFIIWVIIVVVVLLLIKIFSKKNSNFVQRIKRNTIGCGKKRW